MTVKTFIELQNISILNIQLKDAEETENTPVLGHTIGADIIEGFSSQYSTSFLHEHLDSLNFKSEFQIIKGKNLFKGFVNEAITDKITIITNFLSNDLKFQTKQPIGKSVVCENTTSFFNINFTKHVHKTHI